MTSIKRLSKRIDILESTVEKLVTDLRNLEARVSPPSQEDGRPNIVTGDIPEVRGPWVDGKDP